jgi:DNA-directed RNA polymerase specialized sigma24 family protein
MPVQPLDSRRCPNSVRMDTLGSDFDQFVRESSPGLLRTAYLLTGDRGHAEDVVQAALLQVARRWQRIRGEPAPYARRAVVNLARTTGATASGGRARALRPSSPAMPHPTRTCSYSRCCCPR